MSLNLSIPNATTPARAFTDQATRKAFRQKGAPLVILDTCVLVDIVCKTLALPGFARKKLQQKTLSAVEACNLAGTPCPPALKLYDLIQTRALHLATNPQLVQEYQEILADAQHMMPRFNGTEPAQRLAILAALLPFSGQVTGRPSPLHCKDANDQMLFDIAEELVQKGHTDVALVSFDALVLAQGPQASRFGIFHPKDFIKQHNSVAATTAQKSAGAKSGTSSVKPWRTHLR